MNLDNTKELTGSVGSSLILLSQKKMLFWLYFQSSMAMYIHISKLLVNTVFVSPRYLTSYGRVDFPGNHGRPPSIQECLGKPRSVLQTLGG